MKEITITIPGDKVEKIIQYAYIKKMTGNWMPEDDPIDWLAFQVIRADHLQRLNESDSSTMSNANLF